MPKYNYLATLRYWFTKKHAPEFKDYAKMITAVSMQRDLSPKITSPWDLNNWQVFTDGPSRGVFKLKKMSDSERDMYYNRYLLWCLQEGVKPRKNKWLYTSDACNSYDKFRLDIYSPGRIQIKCTLPKHGCGSPWFYYSENTGDFLKPWRKSIDRSALPREVYYEVDLFETFKEKIFERVACSIHFGKQNDRKMKTNGIAGHFSGWHYIDVIWDGKGNYSWMIDGIEINKVLVPLPTCEKIYPFFKMTLMAMDKLPDGVDSSTWKVDWVKFSKTIEL